MSLQGTSIKDWERHEDAGGSDDDGSGDERYAGDFDGEDGDVTQAPTGAAKKKAAASARGQKRKAGSGKKKR